ncbi:cyanophycinase [Massilia sp. PAMC28688]|uniref:cyanophycinase n=1 Tax=Massilia sp. PAMC28688 TaxID=2861283 RepID=UPI001C62A5AB|nr:cyanophycinase [Massilia sp. PAMC28688]QYF95837.1 cyanophycinase [Massilia sp. PAMC28688]
MFTLARRCAFVLLALATAGQGVAQVAQPAAVPAEAKVQPEIKAQEAPKPPAPAEVKDSRAAASAPKGTLVIIGGGLRGENEPVWERIVELAGGRGARIAVFGSASANPERAARLDAQRLNFYGADAFVVPVAVRLKGTDYRAAAEDKELAAKVASAAGAYFVGGDQARITQALRRPDGSSTLMLDSLWHMYRRGGVIAGTSAGAAIMSSTMFYNVRSVLSTLKRGVADGMEMAPGLGFIGDDVFVDQHLLVRGRFARMLPVMLAKGYKLGLGIDENTAMIVYPNREVEVIGYKGALLIDLRNASSVPGTFNVSNARLSYIDNGDRFNIGTHTFTPSPDKAGGKFDPSNPYYIGPLFTADVLGHTTIVDLMTKLIDSDQPDAIGIAFGSPRDLQADLGFEFRLSRVNDSVGYASAIADAYSVYNIRLDVKPIKIQQPFYQYR